MFQSLGTWLIKRLACVMYMYLKEEQYLFKISVVFSRFSGAALTQADVSITVYTTVDFR